MAIRQRQPTSHDLNFSASQAYLQQRSLQSSLITFGSQPLKLLIGIGTTSILARLLTPADFGLVAMALPWFALVESVNSLGLGTAMVQRSHLDHQQASIIFWLSFGINTLLMIGLLLSAPAFAWFYQEPRLILIIPVMALGMASLFMSFQHQSLLARQMRFGILTLIEVGSLALGAGVALVAARGGWSYWALVLQLVTYQVTQSLSYWVACRWRPAGFKTLVQLSQETRHDTGKMLSYGANLSGFHLINRVGMEMDRVLVGYFNGASALGLYSVAYNWAYFPFNQVYLPLINVAISSLSRAAGEVNQYRSQSRQILILMFGLCLPALAFLGVSGDQLLLLLLGDQWIDSFPIFRVLVLSVFVSGFYRVTKWIYLSTGQTHRQLRWSTLHTPVVVAAAAIGTYWGPLGVAWGVTVASLVLTYPAIAFCLHKTPLTMGDFVGAVWRPTVASLAAAGLLVAGEMWLGFPANAGLYLVLSATLFGGAYASSFILLPGGWQEVRNAYQALHLLASKRADR
ncbi:lipopolysaccharide biosynthesis protein [Nodosilinea sp. LEGE 07298]|uniref:lipopolysaccharide biosynthesis protein n=1 Tax=Nodosilinea sp. LEGE 07298 TaxID=2777970 RepID=UPI001882A25E|nr:lipopolysaccharide biosynthesis protein [Nodosilinea sp. LEGE 07298]MBE9112819.1 lipopolysaccharide biosynthesis protein [Nodosilinea sp. LEGE 07298]